MEKRSLKPYFVLMALMLAASVVLAYTVDVRTTDVAGVRVFLPDQVGVWTGVEMRFCVNPACQHEYSITELKDRNVCPACGGPLDSMTFGEKDLLPADTEILKKRYLHPDGSDLYANIVLSGKERASIHRPQICLVAQGFEITRSSVLDVPMNNRKPLDVMVLDLMRKSRARGGEVIQRPSFYAYWFVGKDRETPYHTQRMLWMGADRVFRNISHRWAYISVGGDRHPDRPAMDQERLTSFLHDFYPQMLVPESSPAAPAS